MDERRVISASRRTDLVACYPEILRAGLKKHPPESVHSLVIWTKDPQNMLTEGPLKNLLRDYRQVYVHLTLTGMGGGEFEPMIPPWERTAGMIGPLIELVKDPLRISWRFDPILEAEGEGKRYSNFSLFPRLAAAIGPLGIKICRVSWVSPYRKVAARLEKKGWRLLPADRQRREAQAAELKGVAAGHGMEVHFCSMEGFPVSSCIDGALLTRLHPDGLACSRQKARGQRPLCGCTHSLDIGWYSLKCRQGCMYCYATP